MSIGRSQFASDVEYEQALRDHFAVHALAGIMANPVRWQQIASDYESGKKTYEQCSTANAVKAYSIADAMIRARTNPRGETK